MHRMTASCEAVTIIFGSRPFLNALPAAHGRVMSLMLEMGKLAEIVRDSSGFEIIRLHDDGFSRLCEGATNATFETLWMHCAK